MGSYTRVGLVRSATGLTNEFSPSYTVNFSIQRGEAAMKKYLNITPPSGGCNATGTQISDGTNLIWTDAATSFAAYYLFQRLFSQNAPETVYARGTRTERGASYIGHGMAATSWWDDGIRICDMHGRQSYLKRVQP